MITPGQAVALNIIMQLYFVLQTLQAGVLELDILFSFVSTLGTVTLQYY